MEEVKESKKEGPDEWEIESWARTIVEAEEIKQDSKKMALIKPLLEKKIKAAQKIASMEDLRAVAEKKMISKGEA